MSNPTRLNRRFHGFGFEKTVLHEGAEELVAIRDEMAVLLFIGADGHRSGGALCRRDGRPE